MEKNICPTIARFLAFIYTNQSCRINWNNLISSPFNVRNGVKQGGILSPLLFNIYIDVLLQRLQKCGVGCHIGNKFVGALAYADDILLLCPSVGALKKLLDICEQFSTEYNILFNASKSKFLAFGYDSEIKISFQGSIIPHVLKEKHLGHEISSDYNMLDRIVTAACNDLYTRTNLLLSQFGKANCNIVYKLFKNYCMSIYGCQLWNYEDKSINLFKVAWRKCVRKIYKIPYNTHCDLVHHICDDLNIDEQLHKRFIKFFINAMNSNNDIV